jgi:ubiquitin carboxyl-terminal hydrolase L5
VHFRYNDGEIHFNLMAIVSDRKMTYEKKITQIQKQMEVGTFIDCEYKNVSLIAGCKHSLR